MKKYGGIFMGCMCLLASRHCLAQTPPPNDNFTNRITLTGSLIDFSGTLAGATLESTNEANGGFVITNQGYAPITQSVWWTWTASVSTFVTLEILNHPSRVIYPALDYLAVYNTTNVFASPSPVAAMPLDYGITNQTISFPVTAGTNYQIQLLGSSSSAYTIRLIATNAPIILRQPATTTVSTNDSVLFTVIAAGPGPLTYQWRFYGTNLAAETWAMLALTNLDSSRAGPYSVTIGNSATSIFSTTATLSVSGSNPPPSLAVTGFGSGLFHFTLAGEIGRNYVLESSTNLVDWSVEIPSPGNDYDFIGQIFPTNSLTLVTVSNNTAKKFIRASASPSEQICINNLREISFAKGLWQRETKASSTATPILSDLVPYFPHSIIPTCPNDFAHSFAASYTLGDLQTAPVCKIVPVYHNLYGRE
jgi:hypothetical protein